MASIFNIFRKKAVSPEEIEATIRLTPEERYAYFFEKVSRGGNVWVLCGKGWEERIREKKRLPLWPDREYAMVCAFGVQMGYHPESFRLKELEILLKPLCHDGTKISVFDTPQSKGLVVEEERFRTDVLKSGVTVIAAPSFA